MTDPIRNIIGPYTDDVRISQGQSYFCIGWPSLSSWRYQNAGKSLRSRWIVVDHSRHAFSVIMDGTNPDGLLSAKAVASE